MTLVLAQKDSDTVLAEALVIYKQVTGITLAEGDPRRQHLLSLVLICAQVRGLTDFAGKQSLVGYVSAEFIEDLAELWGEELQPAAASTCTVRFTFGSTGPHTIAEGRRVTDGTSVWSVVEDTTGDAGATYVDAEVRCTVTGTASNGVTAGQIDTSVDSVPGLVSVANTTTTRGGKNVEATEAFRERLRSVPESRSTCGPRFAYEAAALEASPDVADAKCIGPNDGGSVSYVTPDPGEVHIIIIEGTRDEDGVLVEVAPDPSEDLLDTVDEHLSEDEVRPLGDLVIVRAPEFVDLDVLCTYYIPRSRSKQASEIQVAVEEAFEAFLLWQQSKIGRDINPSELNRLLCNAGAKRTVIAEPTFAALLRDQAARIGYSHLTYGGVEDD